MANTMHVDVAEAVQQADMMSECDCTSCMGEWADQATAAVAAARPHLHREAYAIVEEAIRLEAGSVFMQEDILTILNEIRYREGI